MFQISFIVYISYIVMYIFTVIYEIMVKLNIKWNTRDMNAPRAEYFQSDNTQCS